MNYHTVQRDGINHVFPDTIPKKRGKRDVIAKIICGLASITVGCFFTQSKLDYLVYVNTSNYIILIIIEIIRRICNVFEEKHHINSRYDKKIVILMKEIFSINNYNLIISPVTVIVALFAPAGSLYSEKHGFPAWICSLVGVSLISEIINLKENGIYTAMLIEELKGLDYGSGMAHSFYHGYLQLILPQSSSHQKSVKSNIEVYESANNVKFTTKKLYILIPLSAHCPNKLSDESDKIEDGGQSEHIKLDIAGVRDRVYGNTVYKLLPGEDEVIYVMAEYATPLRTLSKAMLNNTDEARRYKRFKKEIVTNFYMTLDKLLREDPECRNYCHLIYYRDIDENGQYLPVDICDLLMERINYNIQNERP